MKYAVRQKQKARGAWAFWGELSGERWKDRPSFEHCCVPGTPVWAFEPYDSMVPAGEALLHLFT